MPFLLLYNKNISCCFCRYLHIFNYCFKAHLFLFLIKLLIIENVQAFQNKSNRINKHLKNVSLFDQNDKFDI